MKTPKPAGRLSQRMASLSAKNVTGLGHVYSKGPVEQLSELPETTLRTLPVGFRHLVLTKSLEMLDGMTPWVSMALLG